MELATETEDGKNRTTGSLTLKIYGVGGTKWNRRTGLGQDGRFLL
jgi:hypothetical protein